MVELWNDNWFGVIVSVTPAFKQYAMSLLLSYANLFNGALELKLPDPVTTNHITEIRGSPRFHGLTGTLVVNGRYAWGFSDTRLMTFVDRNGNDESFTRSVSLEAIAKMTNHLTTNTALTLGHDALLKLAIPLTVLEKKEPIVHQLTDIDDKTLLPLYYIDWGNIRMQVSGRTSNVVELFNVSGALQTLPPTNYFEIIGATNEATRTPRSKLKR